AVPGPAHVYGWEARVDAAMEANAADEPSLQERRGALRHRQPTPGSIVAAESRLGIASPQRVDAIIRGIRGTRRDIVWGAADEALFLERAPAQLHLPLLLALWTGQRQGDLLRLPWSAYDGTHIRLRQGKTGARVVIPAGAR